MALTPVAAVDCLTRLEGYDDIIDARSESEYALDRVPGAINWPSLNDAERILVGTEYKQGLAFRRAQARGGAGGAQHRHAHRTPPSRQAQVVASRSSIAGAAVSAAARWRWC